MINVDRSRYAPRGRPGMGEEMAGFAQMASAQPTGDPSHFDWDALGGGAQPGEPWMGGDQPFTFPGQEYFDLLGGQFQDWMGGMVDEPGAWGEALGYLRPFAETGRPVDVSGIFGAMEPVANRYLEEQSKGLAEQMGVGGLRWSTPLQSGITRETQRMAENMGLAQTHAEISAAENAMARAFGAPGQMANIGGMQGQFGLGAAGLQQGAANQLFNLANTEAMMPLQIGQGMMGMQGQMEGMQNQSMMGQQMNPFLQMAMQMAGQNPTTYGQKGPGNWEQLLNIAGDWLPGFLSRPGGGPGETPTPPANYWGDLPGQAPGYFEDQQWPG